MSNPEFNPRDEHVTKPGTQETTEIVFNPHKMLLGDFEIILRSQIRRERPAEFLIIPKNRDQLMGHISSEMIKSLNGMSPEERDRDISDMVRNMKTSEEVIMIIPSSRDTHVEPALNPSKYSLMKTYTDASESIYKIIIPVKELTKSGLPGFMRNLIDTQIEQASDSPNFTREVSLITNGKITTRLSSTILRSLKENPNNTNNTPSTRKETIENFVGLAQKADQLVIWQKPQIE